MGLKYIIWIAASIFTLGWNYAAGNTLSSGGNQFVQTYKAQYGGY